MAQRACDQEGLFPKALLIRALGFKGKSPDLALRMHMGKTNYLSERIAHWVVVILSNLMMLQSESYGLGTL